MAVYTTRDFSLDQQGVAPAEVIPDALILTTAAFAGMVEGDQPAIHVPYVDSDSSAGFTAEGAAITEAAPATTDVLVHTGKVAVLGKISREQLAHEGIGALLSDSFKRALLRKSNAAYLSQVAPTSPAVTPPAGIITQVGGTATAMGTNLDKVADAIATIEGANGAATHVIAHPTAWNYVVKLKQTTGSNVGVLPAGNDAATRSLYGVPVIVSNSVPSNEMLVLDKSAILSAHGQVQIATSEHVYFGSDSIAIRATFRFGATVADTDRVVRLKGAAS